MCAMWVIYSSKIRKLWILKPICTSNANCYQNWRLTVVKLQFDQRSCSARHSPAWNDASNPSPLSLVWETVMHFASLQENTNVPAHTVRHCILSHIPSVNLVIPHSLFPLIIAPPHVSLSSLKYSVAQILFLKTRVKIKMMQFSRLKYLLLYGSPQKTILL